MAFHVQTLSSFFCKLNKNEVFIQVLRKKEKEILICRHRELNPKPSTQEALTFNFLFISSKTAQCELFVYNYNTELN